MSQIRPLRSFLIKLRSFHVGYRFNGFNIADLPSNSSQKTLSLFDVVNFYTRGTGMPRSPQALDAYLLSLVPMRIYEIKPFTRDQFAAMGVVKYLDDVETLLKQKESDRTKSIDLDLFCSTFYGLAKLNAICQNRIVETCGLERIVNLLKIIVERPEEIKSVKSLELLCHGVSKLDATLEDQSTKGRLTILMKPVIPPLLSRIFASEPSAAHGDFLSRGINRLSKVIDNDFSDEEKTKIARFAWKEFLKIDTSPRKSIPHQHYSAFYHTADLFLKLDINEEKGSFVWVDSFLKRWIDCMQHDANKSSRTKALMHLNFILVGLKNGKYDIIYGQKERWSNALRESRSFLNDMEIETMKEYIRQVPLSDEICKRLVDELDLLFK